MSHDAKLPSPPCKVVPKPWGREEWLVVGDRIVLKRLVIDAGQRFSLQLHEHKEEAWLFVRGRGTVRLGRETGAVGPGTVLHVMPGTVHRVEAIETLEFMEVSTTELDDVVRLEDDYGRSERDEA
ncbi:MAG: phosphomannose isomerase type II C-terminal cupin domain [Acidobacteriota bacterium]|nr:phosphomannose isomerase type II C-terminal cupin domain [Acidobacteriota bacterium]